MNTIDLVNMPASVPGGPDIQALCARIPDDAGVMLSIQPTSAVRYQIVATSASGLAVTALCADIETAAEYLTFAIERTTTELDAVARARPGDAHPMTEQSAVYGSGIVASLSLRAALGAEAEGAAR